MTIGSFSIADAQNTGINTNTVNINNDPTVPPIKITPMFADSSRSLYPDPTNTTSIYNQKQNPYLQNIGNDTKGIRKDSLRK